MSIITQANLSRAGADEATSGDASSLTLPDLGMPSAPDAAFEIRVPACGRLRCAAHTALPCPLLSAESVCCLLPVCNIARYRGRTNQVRDCRIHHNAAGLC